jgi:hypothetical protein
MKTHTLLLCLLIFVGGSKSLANDIDPLPIIQMMPINFMIDNPKGKLKIRFVMNDMKSSGDTTKSKSFFGKLKYVLNSLMDASDNPPFKLQVVREKKN